MILVYIECKFRILMNYIEISYNCLQIIVDIYIMYYDNCTQYLYNNYNLQINQHLLYLYLYNSKIDILFHLILIY